MAALPRYKRRDFTSVFINIKEFIKPIQNAHPPQADSAFESICALMHTLTCLD